MSGFSKSILDEWTLSGRLLWFRVPNEKTLNAKNRPRLHGRTPIVFVPRENLSKFLSGIQPVEFDVEKLDHELKDIYDILSENGSIFLDELSRKVSLTKQKIIPILSEMIHRGLITIDGFTAFRFLANHKKLMEPSITTDLELAGRISINPCLTISRSENKSLNEEVLEYWCQLILRRYGVVCRDLIQREKFSPAWRELAPVYRRLELQGQIRGGRFIEKSDGSQYASKETYEIWTRYFQREDDQWQVISATDPCNIFGVITDQKKVPALRHTKLLIQSGQILAVYQNGSIQFEGNPSHSQKELFSRALRVSGPIRRIDPFLLQEEKAMSSKLYLDNRRPQNLRNIFQNRV